MRTNKLWKPVGVSGAALLLLVSAAFLFGGGSRADIQSLILLRPLSALTLGFAVLTFPPEDIRKYRYIIGFAAAVTILSILHVVPLPNSLWAGLPGREVVSRIDEATGLSPLSRPLSMTPSAALNAAFALMLPLSLLLLTLRASASTLRATSVAIVFWLLVSALLGLMQSAGVALDLYRISSANAGLFSNHNHQAVSQACGLILMSLLTVQFSHGSFGYRPVIARGAVMPLALFAACIFVIPAILATGSRAGIAAMLLALPIAAFILVWNSQSDTRKRQKKAGHRWVLFAAPAGGLALAGIVYLYNLPPDSLGRLLQEDLPNEARWPVWRESLSLAIQYLPIGSGNGSFVEVYQIAEPSQLLSQSYFNHVHNDWLEVFMTTGIPGATLMVVAVVYFIWTCRQLVISDAGRATKTVSVAGLSIVGLLALASVVDYPLRTPSVTCLFIIGVVFARQTWSEPDVHKSGETREIDV